MGLRAHRCNRLERGQLSRKIAKQRHQSDGSGLKRASAYTIAPAARLADFAARWVSGEMSLVKPLILIDLWLRRRPRGRIRLARIFAPAMDAPRILRLFCP